jgi:hypothetical protein
VVHSAKQVVAALAARDVETSGLADIVTRLAARPSVDTITGRRRIADAVIQTGRYPF